MGPSTHGTNARKQENRRPRQMSWKELLPRIKIVNDPKKLAELKAELQRRKLGLPGTTGNSNSKGRS